MATKVYGASDDLIEFEGDLHGEIGGYNSEERNDGAGVYVFFSDGTLLAVKYGKPGNVAIWAISVLRKGELFDRLDICDDEDADPYSDVAHFKAGKLKAWAATECAPVQ